MIKINITGINCNEFEKLQKIFFDQNIPWYYSGYKLQSSDDCNYYHNIYIVSKIVVMRNDNHEKEEYYMTFKKDNIISKDQDLIEYKYDEMDENTLKSYFNGLQLGLL